MLFSRGLLLFITVPVSHAFTCVKGPAYQRRIASPVVSFSSSQGKDDYDDWYADFDPSAFVEPPRPISTSSEGRGSRGGGSGGGRRSHGYTRDTSRDTSNVNIDAVESLLQQRMDARSQRDFQTADDIRDQLLQEHGVKIFDKEMSWRSGCSDSGSGGTFGRRQDSRGGRSAMGGRPESRRTTPDRNFGPNGHDYQRVGPSAENESEIHAAIAERLQCKLNRNFRRADQIQNDLMSQGVFIHDGTKEWRADGQPFEARADKPSKAGRPMQSYTQSPNSEPSDDLERIEELVAERTAAKMARDFRRADDIREELRSDYNVMFDDRLCQWSVGGDFGSASPNTRKEWRQSSSSAAVSPHNAAEIEKMLEERNAARLVRNFQQADAIRDELRTEFNVLINDRESEWWVEQPRGRGSRGGSSERDEYDSDMDGEDSDFDDSIESAEYESTESLISDHPAKSDELEKLTVVELREKLREAGLTVSGKKSELIARLTASA